MEFKIEHVIFLVLAIVMGSLIFKIIKHGGFKAAMFGAKIRGTVGEVIGSGPGSMKLSLKVHELDADGSDRVVGLELVAKSIGSYQAMPITLGVSEARKLAELIDNIIRTK